ncbi:TonB-dependent receptor [Thioalkalivibrio nitratireducens DSM 14787]|uniref:TonB-dependent receptor n=1 Tax=Thioalkalivibrio nitratireducens (strain DSM 14787 / UNIQEM 213 / ALEN2) TaxID=1255043 RepID=L0E1W2_THIND|nr:TonB-dependent receptor [Thioalkalivibrio nitratireducens]AGA35195.1 TonB-dependent receptor [Thioalkalivibrio nitratireducens DSM 14787]
MAARSRDRRCPGQLAIVCARWPAFAVALLHAGATAGAEVPHTLDPITVTVTAPRLEVPLSDLPAAVDRVDREDATRARQGLQLDEALNRVPGLFAQNRYNFAQDVRLSIRGFGARAPFGIRGLRLLQDGIPETTPDGQSQVDAIDLLNIDSIEVLRGPNAALYGNATGGVIAIGTLDGSDPRGHGAGLLAGSHGFRRIEGVSEAAAQTGSWSLTAHELRYPGYREQARAEKRLLRLHAQQSLEAGDLRLHLRVLDAPLTEDPGALTRSELDADRRTAAPLARVLDSRQSAEQLTLGAQWRQRAGAGELRLGAFVTRRDYAQQLPFFGSSQVAYERRFEGLHLGYERDLGPTRALIGFDLEGQRDDRTRHCINAALEPSCAPPGQPETGPLALDQRERARSRGVFLQTDTLLGSDWNLVLGARHDRIRFGIDDHLRAGGEDLSGSRVFDETSISAGLVWHWRPGHRAFANAASAFETPTFTEFANPAGTGGFNPDLDPQQAHNVELGLRGDAGRLSYDLTLYSARVRDELVPFELDSDDGRTYFSNAGRTARDGIELGLEWHSPGGPWRLRSALALNDFRYREFTDAAGADQRGNRLPGLPRQQWFLEAAWSDGPAFFAVDALYTGRRNADDANRVTVGSQTTVNLRAGRHWDRGALRTEGFLALNNVFDARTIDNVRINARFGRYFEPAPGRTLLAGVRVYARP